MSRELLHRFAAVIRADIVYEDAEGGLIPYFDSVEDSPLMKDPLLRELLRSGAAEQDKPYVLRDDFSAYYLSGRWKNGWLYIGPMMNTKPDPLQLSAFYRSHNISPEDVRNPRAFTMRQIKDISVLVFSVLQGTPVEENDFLVKNPVFTADEQEIHRGLSESAGTDEAARDDEAYKHTYHEEQQLLQAAMEGRTDDVIRLSERLDEDSGRLSERDINHWRAVAVIGITLISRAAIQGGVSPETAYRVSGYYISKSIAASERGVLLYYRNRAIEDLVGRVKQAKGKPQGSPYTVRCKDYIRKHFREKIYIEAISEPLGISAGYLAKLFKKETGLSIQEFTNQVRVERAANLLIYSEKSLSEIADYVHFPSQSYFGKIFRGLKGMTPNEFRKRNKIHEFYNE